MKETFIFKAIYYINNTLFSCFLFFFLLGTYSMSLIVFKKMQIINTANMVTQGEFISSIQDYTSILLCTIALYQSFLVLYKIKKNTISLPYWVQKFKIAGYLFLLVAFINLFKTSITKDQLFLPFFKLGSFTVGLTPGVVILILAFILFVNISNIKSIES